FFVESCRHNPEVEWLVPTDQPPPANLAANIRFMPTSFADFLDRASRIMGVDVRHSERYKLCDIKPFYGLIFEDEIRSYRSFGFCDIDIIWGNIRQFYTDELLDRFELISFHGDRVAGHLTIMRNSPK